MSYTCGICGREFTTKQALGGHKSMAHKDTVGLAEAFRRDLAVAVGGSRKATRKATTHYPLATAHYPLPATKPLPTTRYPLPTSHYPLEEDLIALERRVKNEELASKLRRREQVASGRQMRQFAIALVLVGVAIYFLNGGDVKLPFFGNVS